MRVSALASILVAAGVAIAAPAQAAEPIHGQWFTKDKRAIVLIAACGNTLCGKITRLVEPPKGGVTTDVNNPDPVLKKRKLVGLPILTGFVADGTVWRGKIYDPNNGKTYRSVVSRDKNGTLSVEGCVAVFCQSQTWTPAR